MPKLGEGSDESSSNVMMIVVALIGAIGLVAAAFVSGAFGGHSVGLGPSPAVTVTETVVPSASVESDGTSTNGPPSGSASDAAQWQGQALIPTTGGLTFSTLPPSDIPDGGQISWSPRKQQIGTYSVNVSPWTGKSAPSEAQCRNLTTSDAEFNYTFNDVKVGTAFCLDAGGNPDYEVYVQVKSIDSFGAHVYSEMWDTSS